MERLSDSREIKTLGQIAFEAYAKAKQGVTYDAKPIPEWDALGDDVRAAWDAAAYTAIKVWRLLMQLQEPSPEKFAAMRWLGDMARREQESRAEAERAAGGAA
jgi:hypothetical protein